MGFDLPLMTHSTSEPACPAHLRRETTRRPKSCIQRSSAKVGSSFALAWAIAVFAGSSSLPCSALIDSELPPLIDYSGPPPVGEAIPEGEARILHTWPDKVFLAFDTRNHLLLWDSSQGRFERHDGSPTTSGTAIGSPVPDVGRVLHGAMNRDRTRIATVSVLTPSEGQIRVWNSETGNPAGPPIPVSEVTQAIFGLDEQSFVAIAALDGSVSAWDAKTAAKLWTARPPYPMPTTWLELRPSPDGRLLAARHRFGVLFWNMVSREVVGDIRHRRIADISDDWAVAVGSESSPDLRIPSRPATWRLEGPGRFSPLPHGPPDHLLRSAETLAVSADGSRIAIASREHPLRVWNLGTHTAVEGTQKTQGRVMRMLFSPDNRLVATWELETGPSLTRMSGKVQVWDVADLLPLGTPRSNPGAFHDWRFSPDSRLLVVSFSRASDDLGVQVWRMPLRATAGEKNVSR